jgi:hypothetical protein
VKEINARDDCLPPERPSARVFGGRQQAPVGLKGSPAPARMGIPGCDQIAADEAPENRVALLQAPVTIEQPYAYGKLLQDGRKPRLAVTERFLGALALTDVPRDH